MMQLNYTLNYVIFYKDNVSATCDSWKLLEVLNYKVANPFMLLCFRLE